MEITVMANNGMNINRGNGGEDRTSRIARILIMLAVVLLVGYMVSRADNVDREIVDNQVRITEENTGDNAIAETTEEQAGELIGESEDEVVSDTESIAPELIEEIDAGEPSGTIEVPDETLSVDEPVSVEYKFRNANLLNQHYEKHGIEMGFDSAADYEKAAAAVINNPNALHKIEAEDGDYVFYVEATNEFVIVSTDGYIRTYFLPSGGKKYYDKQ